LYGSTDQLWWEKNQSNLDLDDTIVYGISKLSNFSFDQDYTVTEIQDVLNGVYENAPDIIKQRVDKTNRVIEEAKKYIAEHYITEQGV
jgi:hypothetical protein